VDIEAEIRSAERDYEKALADIRKGKAGSGNAGLEGKLGQAHQRLVRLGARPQLKLKYRGR
jgi:hypothetical protein